MIRVLVHYAYFKVFGCKSNINSPAIFIKIVLFILNFIKNCFIKEKKSVKVESGEVLLIVLYINMRLRIFYTSVFLFFLLSIIYGQIPVGEWRDHLPYRQVIEVAEAENKIYAATDGGAIFFVDKADDTFQKMSKVHGLSDVGVSAIGYSEKHQFIIIGYANGNLDLLKNEQVYNIPYIKNKMIYGSKSINHVLVVDDYAYLSCGFGIVVTDLAKKEIKETYYIGEDGEQLFINEMAFSGKYLYAATVSGVYKADINTLNLIDYTNWQRIEKIPNHDKSFNTITWFKDKIYVNHRSEMLNSDEIYLIDHDDNWEYFTLIDNISNCKSLKTCYGQLVLVNTWYVYVWDKEFNRLRHFSTERQLHAIMDKDDNLWIGDKYNGLIKNESSWHKKSYYPSGPMYNTVTDFSILNNKVWAAAGGPDVSAGGDKWNNKGAFLFENEEWININKQTYNLLEGIKNINTVVIDPEDPAHVWAGSYGYGIVEFQNKEIVNIYDENNSILENVKGFTKGYVLNTGLAYDNNHNLWIANSILTNPLYVISEDKFYNYELNFTDEVIDNLTITKNNHIWFTAYKDNTRLFVFDYNSTIADTDDDRSRYFVLKNSNNESFNTILSIAEDKKGQVWVGTNQGVLVYYNPEQVFNSNEFYAQQIKIPRDDGSGLADLLLETESVTAIAVDGANQKWFGTRNAGVFLFSADGTKQLKSFNTDNSPLLSNNIYTIAINHETGEVFFGTEKGIISYRGEVTKGGDEFGKVYVFPNPVRENYHGTITITGMPENANVKITDVSGNLVYETESLGGQAVWDGNSFNGQRVHTGVYLVFCSNKDGTKTHVTKLLFIH